MEWGGVFSNMTFPNGSVNFENDDEWSISKYDAIIML